MLSWLTPSIGFCAGLRSRQLQVLSRREGKGGGEGDGEGAWRGTG